MASNKEGTLRILVNDYRANLPSSDTVPQGGTERFAQAFTAFFHARRPAVAVVSLLFAHNPDAATPRVRRSAARGRVYYEIVHDAARLRRSYSKTYAIAAYRSFLEPWVDAAAQALADAAPDVVFLNGFSLTNWMLMEAAHRRRIPVCIQHAGIWKKELAVSGGAFSPSVRRIFNRFEKEAFWKTARQVFLNDFSRDAFFTLHGAERTKELLRKTSVIPLPVERAAPRPFPERMAWKGRVRVGVVARWDAIKNHAAVLRLAAYADRAGVPLDVSCVTRPPRNARSDFFERYRAQVEIVPPMAPAKLRAFYASCGLVLVPSRFDVSPTVVLEALAAGKPVIVSSRTGWADQFRRAGLGDCVIEPSASGRRICETALRVADGYGARRERFERLRRRLLEAHDPETVFQTYYQLFVSLAS